MVSFPLCVALRVVLSSNITWVLVSSWIWQQFLKPQFLDWRSHSCRLQRCPWPLHSGYQALDKACVSTEHQGPLWNLGQPVQFPSLILALPSWRSCPVQAPGWRGSLREYIGSLINLLQHIRFAFLSKSLVYSIAGILVLVVVGVGGPLSTLCCGPLLIQAPSGEAWVVAACRVVMDTSFPVPELFPGSTSL